MLLPLQSAADDEQSHSSDPIFALLSDTVGFVFERRQREKSWLDTKVSAKPRPPPPLTSAPRAHVRPGPSQVLRTLVGDMYTNAVARHNCCVPGMPVLIVPQEVLSGIEGVGQDPWLDEADDGEEEDGEEDDFVVNPMSGESAKTHDKSPWIKRIDSNSNVPYWWNTNTGESSWHPPKDDTTLVEVDLDDIGITSLDDDGLEMTTPATATAPRSVAPKRATKPADGGVGGLKVEERGKVIKVNMDGTLKVKIMASGRVLDRVNPSHIEPMDLLQVIQAPVRSMIM